LGFCVSRVLLKIGLVFIQVTKDRHAIIFHDDYIIIEDKVLSQDSLLIVILNILANTRIWKLFRLIAGLGHTGSCNLCTMKLWRLQSTRRNWWNQILASICTDYLDTMVLLYRFQGKLGILHWKNFLALDLKRILPRY
jgi:glycerophosphoryl diester phosphodiesterase